MAMKGGKPENLKPWPKGKSGNPAGRPKIPDLHELMAKVLGQEKRGKTEMEAVLEKLKNVAKKGNVRAAELLLNRNYGMPKQAHEISGPGGKDLFKPDLDSLTNDEKLALARLLEKAGGGDAAG